MILETTVDKDMGIRYHSLQGRIEVEELKSKLLAFYESDAEVPEMSSIWDLRKADFSAVD